MAETVFGDRLQQARTLRQRRQAEVAELLGCAVPTLSKWERAETVDLSAGQVANLAESLRFSPFFFSSRPSAPLADNDLLFKAPKGMLKRESAWLREFIRLLAELTEWLDDRRHLPPVRIRLVSRQGITVAEAARDLRDALSLPQGTPIEYLTHSAERAGVVVAVRRRGAPDRPTWDAQAELPGAGDDNGPDERHEGCSTWIGEFRERPLVLIRGIPGWEKTRWVLAHELGHLSLHAGRMPVSAEAEEQASRFASELLAPIDVVSQELPRAVTLAALLELKIKWGISLAALIRHLHVNNVISDERKATLYRQLYTRKNPETGRSYGATEPGWDKSPPERPQMLSAWLRYVVGNVNPDAIALATGIFPPDLLTSVLSEQRASTGTGIKPNVVQVNTGNVVSLSDRRRADSASASVGTAVNPLRPSLKSGKTFVP